MNPTELLTLAQQYMSDNVLIVFVVLLLIGYFLKRTPHVQDWMIPYALTAAGILLACGILKSFTIESVVQGILAAGVASLTHQLWKQTSDKRSDDQS
ncbi:phage holin family protein [Brevibacillus sp. DP1.3A]|uniref:phage holin family protein n=1 Tax=Brevibacillus sp. DP1.3A TaxID=2738867 RepID=UPI00156AD5AB|nr:phage holin family protein [Brevibacillus sp. DP1.3A]UED78065.1 phage holin family protein [Brevibacillus sp. DP1.3A]